MTMTKHSIRWPGISGTIVRTNYGYRKAAASGVITIASRVGISYDYEPEYTQAHSAYVSYMFGNGRSISFSFSWPQL